LVTNERTGMANVQFKINKPALLYTAGLSLFVVLSFLFKLYWLNYSSEKPVFPVSTDLANVRYLSPQSTLEQSFRVPEKTMTGLRIIFPGSEMPPEGTLFIAVEHKNGRESIELTATHIRENPQIIIELASKTPIDPEAFIRLDWNHETDSLPFYSIENPLLKQPVFLGKLIFEGQDDSESLLFEPQFEPNTKLVEGDVFDFKYELGSLFERITGGRPVWVQWMFVVGLTLFLATLPISMYLYAVEIMQGIRKENQYQIILRCAFLILMGALL
jgi:hypothetical protein